MPESWGEALAAMPLECAPDPGGRVVVLSAHPDDEVLAVGAWLAGQVGRHVEFVNATDGEGSHPDSSAVTADELRERRPHELRDALGHLGFDEPVIHRLRLPDGGLTGSRAELRAHLRLLLGGAALVLAPFESDGHPDHDALGDVARDLCADGTAVLWQFPIWTWVWTRPDDQPWLTDARVLESSADARVRKQRALAAFVTQVQPLGDADGDAPIVDDALMRHATEAPEVVLV